MPRFRITVSNPSKDRMIELVTKLGAAVLDHSVRRGPDGAFEVDILGDAAEEERLRQEHFTVVRHEDVDAEGKRRQREVNRTEQ